MTSFQPKPYRPGPGDRVRYWHPVRGGWYSGTVLSVGRKWVRLRASIPNVVIRKGKRVTLHRTRRVLVTSIRPPEVKP